jgi:hypothetical protein
VRSAHQRGHHAGGRRHRPTPNQVLHIVGKGNKERLLPS